MFLPMDTDRHGAPEPSASERFDSVRSALLQIFYTENIAYCHVDTAAEMLVRLPASQIGPVLGLVELIACSVSDMLAFSFMEHVGAALGILEMEQVEDWVRGALAVYEAEGLLPARRYLSNVEETALGYARDDRVVTLEETAKRLRLLVAGLAGRELPLRHSDVICTDTAAIYGPRVVSSCRDRAGNALLYRMLVLHKGAQVRYQSFLLPLTEVQERFPGAIPPGEGVACGETAGIEFVCERLLPGEEAGELYALVDTVRIEAALSRDFPGLGRDLDCLKALLMQSPEAAEALAPRPVAQLVRWILQGYPSCGPEVDQALRRVLVGLRAPGVSAIETAVACAMLSERDRWVKGLESARRLLPYIGTLRPRAVARELLRRRKECEKRVVEILATLVVSSGNCESDGEGDDRPEMFRGLPVPTDGDGGVALLVPPNSRSTSDPDRLEAARWLMLQGQNGTFGEELQGLLEEIRSDLGEIPAEYVSGAIGFARGTCLNVDVPQESGTEPVTGAHVYDEWDFRRRAYRRQWCSLKEMRTPKGRGDFLAQTLRRHRGQIAILRRQFEMLRQGYRSLRRQREGEDLDLDALVEAYADSHASVSPSENLFIRQKRVTRDIAVAFLVDMSASTEGWINQAIKESLVLLCEAIEMLGDRYAVYGFTGMRRTDCHFFRIKNFEDRYDEEVKERITGIEARDYTRMGPPIRHVIRLMRDVEARLKILITLSDGKPEDYDEYKGPYAVEDTRMALIEAREEGVRPFCITIDKEAREYLPHMYGEVNYCLVPDVSVLHRRVPEIYRLLTT